MLSKVYITKRFGFEACHHLVNYDGKCANVHGHSYKLEVTVSKYIDTQCTEYATDLMVLDFKRLKDIVNREVIDKFDHSDLNVAFENPTAEAMCVSFYNSIKVSLLRYVGNVHLESVKLWETEDSYAEYRGE